MNVYYTAPRPPRQHEIIERIYYAGLICTNLVLFYQNKFLKNDTNT